MMKKSAILLGLFATPVFAAENPQATTPMKEESRGHGPWVMANATEVNSAAPNLVWLLNTQTGTLMICADAPNEGIKCTAGGWPAFQWQLSHPPSAPSPSP